MAACLLAVAPDVLGGLKLRSPASGARMAWTEKLAALMPGLLVKIPASISDQQLIGGLDLEATLATGHPVLQAGALVRADGGLIVLSMAERLPPSCAAQIATALDDGAVRMERDGLSQRLDTQFAVVAFDEGETPDETTPAALSERLAMHIQLPPAIPGDAAQWPDAAHITAARAKLRDIELTDQQIDTLATAAFALGIPSLRAPLLAARVARASAALAGRELVEDSDIILAARLVLGPRARHLPSDGAHDEQAPPPPQPENEDNNAAPLPDSVTQEPRQLDDMVLEAATAAIPADLLALLNSNAPRSRRKGPTGPAGESTISMLRGRPLASRKGDPRRRARIDLLATLMSAAPWQKMRKANNQQANNPQANNPQANNPQANNPSAKGLVVRPDDLRIKRFKERRGSTTIFVVDASGSTARDRLAEAKGAVEILLADCYVRRDQVALVAFRGRAADMLLPPTRSLARARRCLASLPGGGGTPLASGLDMAARVAADERRKGRTPTIVIITDGRANVGRDGEGGRERAQAEAEQAASTLAFLQLSSIMIDNAPRPEPKARSLATRMGASYVALPMARASTVAAIVRAHGATL
jgi:magnesium chelatase subunit D